jgi:hypothetical protein
MGKLRVRATQGSEGNDEDIEQAIAALKGIRNPLMRYWLVQLIDLIAQTCTEPMSDETLSHLMHAPTTKRQ